MTDEAGGGPVQISAFEPLPGSSGLARTITLERDGDGWRNPNCVLNIAGQVLGGQLAAHAIVAAKPANPAFEPSALHLLFVDGGDPRRHYRIAVEALRDGRRMAHRTVRIGQAGKTLITASVIFRSEPLAGAANPFAYHGPMPDVPAPEALARRTLAADDPDRLNREMMASYPFLEIRGPSGYVPGTAGLDDTRDYYWLRIADSRDLPAIDHFALLTLASDFWYTLPIHGLDRSGKRLSFMTTSLDHAVWFHRRPDCSKWMLVETQGLCVHQGIGLKRATIWSRQGLPIATVMQQALIRG